MHCKDVTPLPVFSEGRKGKESSKVLATHAPEAVVTVEAFVEILGEVFDSLPVELPAGQ